MLADEQFPVLDSQISIMTTDEIKPYIGLIGLALGSLVFVACYFAANLKFAEERGLVPRLTMRTGAKLWGSPKINGNGYSSWPFLRVSFYDDFLALSGISALGHAGFVLKYENIRTITSAPLGVRIYHNCVDAPPTIVLYSLDFRTLRSVIPDREDLFQEGIQE